MTRWLPHFHLAGATLCDRDGESEGLTWLGVTIELTIARRTRTFG